MGNLKAQFESDGYLVIEGFNQQEECDALMNRGETLANNFDFKGHPSVFQTTEQTKTTDDYFLHKMFHDIHYVRHSLHYTNYIQTYSYFCT